MDESRTETVRPRPTPDALGRRDSPRPEDDWTFRPSVVIRRGGSQGSGTVIASAEGETLILTAAHVVRDSGLTLVELHRFNLGLEGKADGGRWPLTAAAELIGSDPAADVAILRLQSSVTLPYVARLYDDDPDDLEPESVVTSLGVDLGARLSSWNTRLVETTRFQLEKGDSERPFLITLKIPEHGRSGGGLFTTDGRLVGVCVGHAEMFKGRRMGVFASIESVRRLIRKHNLAAVIEQTASPRRGLAGPRHEPDRRRRQPASTPDDEVEVETEAERETDAGIVIEEAGQSPPSH